VGALGSELGAQAILGTNNVGVVGYGMREKLEEPNKYIGEHRPDVSAQSGIAVAAASAAMPRIALTAIGPGSISFCFCHVASLSAGIDTGWA
jgi:hypothetical protein